jgi:hypothetical protein
MVQLQELIHKLEEGAGVKGIRVVLAFVALAALAVVYDFRCYRNFGSEEAMDSAQLARNIATGRGFSTDCIRPLSLYLVKSHRDDGSPMLKPPLEHPDIVNPPVYPVVLAGLMKTLPFDFEVKDPKKDTFSRYQPEILIAVFNQVLFLVAILMLFYLARRLFDSQVAWISASILALNGALWKFSISGNSTMLLMVIGLGLAWLLTLMDEGEMSPEAQASPIRLVLLAGLAGLVIGVGTLTRYSFGLLILPALLFVIFWSPRIRLAGSLSMLIAFLVVTAPWCVRNVKLSGNPFGIAGYAPLAAGSIFPGDTLDRSLEVTLIKGTEESKVEFNRQFTTGFHEITRKLVVNLREVLGSELPRLGATWAAAFFLPGLLLPFQNSTRRRLRWFVVMAIIPLTLAQALGRTHLSERNPDINTENYLILLLPLVIMFGSVMFNVLLDQIDIVYPPLRTGSIVGFVAVCGLALGLHLLPPTINPVAYPPYYPPVVSQVGKWMNDKEITMTDVPWALAWYGQKRAVDLTLDSKEEFYRINDEMQNISGLYLTPATIDLPFQTEMAKTGKATWGRFVAESIIKQEVPTGFPLKRLPPGFLPEQLFLTDWDRWVKDSGR